MMWAFKLKYNEDSVGDKTHRDLVTYLYFNCSHSVWQSVCIFVYRLYDLKCSIFQVTLSSPVMLAFKLKYNEDGVGDKTHRDCEIHICILTAVTQFDNLCVFLCVVFTTKNVAYFKYKRWHQLKDEQWACTDMKFCHYRELHVHLH